MTTTITAVKASAPTRRRFTVAEYYAMAKAGILARKEPVELLDGDIIVLPPTHPWHQGSVDHLAHDLVISLRRRSIVSVHGPARLSEFSETMPDVMLLKWRDDFYGSGHPKPDSIHLIIEVSVATLDYDRIDKLSAYARAGIPEFWIVSRDDRRIEAYTEPSEGTYSKVRHVGPGETIAPQAFPDVTLEVGQFFPKSKPRKSNKP